MWEEEKWFGVHCLHMCKKTAWFYGVSYTHLLENVEHCGDEPEQAANMYTNRLSFMLKWWTEVVAFMSVIYVQPLPEAISTRLV